MTGTLAQRMYLEIRVKGIGFESTIKGGARERQRIRAVAEGAGTVMNRISSVTGVLTVIESPLRRTVTL